jgi:hypothetical protein
MPRRIRLKHFDPVWSGTDEFDELSKDQLKKRAVEYLEHNRMIVPTHRNVSMG